MSKSKLLFCRRAASKNRQLLMAPAMLLIEHAERIGANQAEARTRHVVFAYHLARLGMAGHAVGSAACAESYKMEGRTGGRTEGRKEDRERERVRERGGDRERQKEKVSK